MIKLLLTNRISHIEYSKNQTLVNATRAVVLIYRRMLLQTLVLVGIWRGIYKAKIKLERICKKDLHFDFESSIIIEHQKSVSKTRSRKVKTLKKRSKKVVDKKNSDCYTKQAVPHKTSEQRGPKSKRKGKRKRAEHLENYIVQETKNKPVILRQEHRKMLKLKNET